MPHPRRAHRAPVRTSLVVLTGLAALLAATLPTSAQAEAGPQGAATTHHVAAHELSAQARKDLRKQLTSPSAAGHARTTRAIKALARAQRALAPSTPADQRPDATLALRKLWELKGDLPTDKRKLARALTARPKLPMDVGNAHFKVHYDPSTLTGYSIDDALATLDYVSETYAAAGYRRPPSDGKKGGDGRLDVYLAPNEPGLYGYCVSDQPRAVKPGHYNAYSYCVLDDNYAGYPAHTPLENLQVTVAHEYFHAVQFGYDLLEDKWMLEATATWAEDQLYPDINDNYQYLADSPITKPTRSMDNGESFGYYGDWSFFRFLTEAFPTKIGPLPELMLRIWQNADSSHGPRRNMYSTQAINKALRKYDKTSLADQFARYSAANRNTHLFYAEGAALNYPTKPLAGTLAMGPGMKKGIKSKLNHLTSSTYLFTPTATPAGTSLKLRFHLGAKNTSPRAVVISYGPGGVTAFDVVKPNKAGIAKAKLDFASASTTSVEVSLVNASARFAKCYTSTTPFSCGGGVPRDQKRQMVVRGKVSS